MTLYIQPKNFADHLSNEREYCLFLDIDGTLADFTINPKDSIIPKTTLSLLQEAQSHDVKIAIVTGRSLTEARRMLSPLKLPIAATHGLEIAFDSGTCINRNSDDHDTVVAQVNIMELAAIRQAIIQSCLPYDNVTIENKPYSVALHYRQNPSLADMAYRIMSTIVKKYSNWILKKGKYVWEIVPKGVNKGTAILTLLENMRTNDNLCAIFIGDDITDEAGFRAVQGDNESRENRFNAEKYKPEPQGIGIKVGSEPTCAHYYVHDIREVTLLIHSLLHFCQKRVALP